ncbi:hypothetical protein RU86_GL001355 [Lactococcus piscium]|uniref:Uncharacterized protein n=1 Tax=Pseudolactococcus piscium TaxID=1364 RepID=A0A2A5RUT5_9LACT|nr:hypothetical protein [Lactococcus piscium]PCS04982.1 hypothetical protein RU86_GL001355 [Lactococcus piscium]
MIDIYSFVEELLSCSTTIEKINIYKKWNIDNCRIYLFDENQSNFSTREANVKIGNFELLGLGDYQRTWIIDKNTSKNSENHLLVGKIVHYDLNILTYINNIFRDRKVKQHTEFIEFLKLIKLRKFANSISTALMERFATPVNNKILGETIESFVFFDVTQIEIFLGSIKPILTTEQYTWMKKIWEAANSYINGVEYRQYNAICCYVMKAFILKNSTISIKEKIVKFMDYCLNTLYIYLENEFILLILYLKNDEATKKTFEKLQIAAKKIEDKIYNTAWDIFQVRLLEQSIVAENENLDKVYLPYLATADKGLQNILKINPVKMFVQYNNMVLAIREIRVESIISELELAQVKSDSLTRSNKVSEVDFKYEKEKLQAEITELVDNN